MNRPADGVDRCACGCKYWENGRCVDCGDRMPGQAGGFLPQTVDEYGEQAVRAALEANRRFRETGDPECEWVLDVSWDSAVQAAHRTGDAEAALRRWVAAAGSRASAFVRVV